MREICAGLHHALVFFHLFHTKSPSSARAKHFSLPLILWSGTYGFFVFFWQGALFQGLGDPPVFEKPAWYWLRQGLGFIRPPLCPMSPTICSPYGGASGRSPHKLLRSVVVVTSYFNPAKKQASSENEMIFLLFLVVFVSDLQSRICKSSWPRSWGSIVWTIRSGRRWDKSTTRYSGQIGLSESSSSTEKKSEKKARKRKWVAVCRKYF